MPDDTDTEVLKNLPPEKLLEVHEGRLIRAALPLMGTAETVQQYIDYEKHHHQRDGVLRWLSQRASDLRDDDPSSADSSTGQADQSHDEESDQLPGESPDLELLKALHERGAGASTTWQPAYASSPPTWDEL